MTNILNDISQGKDMNLYADRKQNVNSSREPDQPIFNEPMVTNAALHAFYQHAFPFTQLHQWLSYDTISTKSFTNREFAFTLPGDVYLRYQSFQTGQDLKKEILRLTPSRFEIGPVYTQRPRDRKTLRKAALKPVEKELVFDIDLTDYDDIRTCCSDKTICRRCWQFIVVAMKILDERLREDFGFNHLLWVYSGRRGVHVWVCDEHARELDDAGRAAIVSYLDVVRGGAQKLKKVSLQRPLHPSLSRALDIVKPNFRAIILQDQDCFREKWQGLVVAIPDKDFQKSLQRKFQQEPATSSEKRWSEVSELASTFSAKNIREDTVRNAQQDVVFQYLYPRLDAEVSKHLNHLLKSPFCVHPNTGRICVPIDPQRAEEFDPLKVPTINTVLAEIDGFQSEIESNEAKDKITIGSEKTSLWPYVEIFDKHVKELLHAQREKRRAQELMTS